MAATAAVPPALNTTAAEQSSANHDAILSPIDPSAPNPQLPRQNTLPPYIDTTAPALNSTPLELDGTATEEVSPDTKRRSDRHDEEADLEELTGVQGQGSLNREKRATLLSQRSQDPAVLVDIPHDPGAEELAAANMSKSHAVATGENPIVKSPTSFDEKGEEVKKPLGRIDSEIGAPAIPEMPPTSARPGKSETDPAPPVEGAHESVILSVDGKETTS